MRNTPYRGRNLVNPAESIIIIISKCKAYGTANITAGTRTVRQLALDMTADISSYFVNTRPVATYSTADISFEYYCIIARRISINIWFSGTGMRYIARCYDYAASQNGRTDLVNICLIVADNSTDTVFSGYSTGHSDINNSVL